MLDCLVNYLLFRFQNGTQKSKFFAECLFVECIIVVLSIPVCVEDIEGVATSTDYEHEDEEEVPHVVDGRRYQVEVECGVFKYSEPPNEVYPHDEDYSENEHYRNLSFDYLYKLVEQQKQVQQDGSNVSVILQALEVFASLLDHLSYFDGSEVGCTTKC